MQRQKWLSWCCRCHSLLAPLFKQVVFLLSLFHFLNSTWAMQVSTLQKRIFNCFLWNFLKKHFAAISAFFANVSSLPCLYHWQSLSLLISKSRTGASQAYKCYWCLENTLPRAWSLAEREELHLPLPMPPCSYNVLQSLAKQKPEKNPQHRGLLGKQLLWWLYTHRNPTYPCWHHEG